MSIGNDEMIEHIQNCPACLDMFDSTAKPETKERFFMECFDSANQLISDILSGYMEDTEDFLEWEQDKQ